MSETDVDSAPSPCITGWDADEALEGLVITNCCSARPSLRGIHDHIEEILGQNCVRENGTGLGD